MSKCPECGEPLLKTIYYGSTYVDPPQNLRMYEEKDDACIDEDTRTAYIHESAQTEEYNDKWG